MAESGSRVAGWVWVFTPLTVAGFIGFLYYLSEIPTNDDEIIVQQPSIDKEEIIKPLLTEEQFEFYQLLENEKVEPPSQVPQTAQDSKQQPTDGSNTGLNESLSSFSKSLQAGSFQNSNDAEQLKAQLILMGLDVSIEKADVKGAQWHRVFVGPFDNRSSLSSAQDQLASMDIAAIVVSKKK